MDTPLLQRAFLQLTARDLMRLLSLRSINHLRPVLNLHLPRKSLSQHRRRLEVQLTHLPMLLFHHLRPREKTVDGTMHQVFHHRQDMPQLL